MGIWCCWYMNLVNHGHADDSFFVFQYLGHDKSVDDIMQRVLTLFNAVDSVRLPYNDIFVTFQGVGLAHNLFASYRAKMKCQR